MASIPQLISSLNLFIHFLGKDFHINEMSYPKLNFFFKFRTPQVQIWAQLLTILAGLVSGFLIPWKQIPDFFFN
jgi:hypothetical protein